MEDKSTPAVGRKGLQENDWQDRKLYKLKEPNAVTCKKLVCVCVFWECRPSRGI